MAKARLTTGTRILLIVASAVIVIGGAREARGLIVPFIFAMFLAVILYSPLRFLRRRGVPTWVALLLVMSALGGIVFWFGTLIGNSTHRFIENRTEIQAQLEQEKARLIDRLKDLGIDATSEELSRILDPQQPMTFLVNALQQLLKGFSQLFLILLMVIFMLLEATRFHQKLQAVSIDGSKAIANADEITTNVRRYLSIKTFTSGLTGILIWGWDSALGLDYAIMFGLLAFLLNYVPNVGSVIASFPAILLALVQSGFEYAIICGCGYIVVNCVISYIIEPRFMGHGLGLSVLVVFLSLIFWGWVLGPAGMFLSAPLTMILKIILYGGDDTRWLGILMGSGAELESSTSSS